MKNSRVAIYFSKLSNPLLNFEIQEKYCKIQAKLLNYERIEIFKDIDILMNDLNFYDGLIIFSLENIGTKYTEILERIENIFKSDVKLICFSEPINLKGIGELFSQKAIISAIIANIVYSKEKWDEAEKYLEEN